MTKIAKVLFVMLVFLVGLAGGGYLSKLSTVNYQLSGSKALKNTEKLLDKYTIENLGERRYQSDISLDEAVATTSAFTVYKFHIVSDGKKVTGLAHIPSECIDKCPVIAQFRGYANIEDYYQGYGTKKARSTWHRTDIFL